MARSSGNSGDDTSSRSRESRWWFLVRPQVIYGTVIVSAVIVAARDDIPDWELILLTLGTVAIVWVAHVFSEVVAGEHAITNPPTPFGIVVRHATGHASGILVSAVLPLVCLILGSLGWVPGSAAYVSALTVGVLSLAVLGWLVFAHRGNAWPIRLAGAVGTALLGAIVVALNAFIH